jgi:DNA-directed RNA polymerase specialized sigma24 family protein
MDASLRKREKKRDLTRESFDLLLDWLDTDRESAGREYERIRARLIRIFACRGCRVPEELADETINRVARKVREVAGDYKGDPAFYFYAVGLKVYLEYSKSMPSVLPVPAPATDRDDFERRLDCLDRCLDALSSENREIIMAYYGAEAGSKKEVRKNLAAKLGIGPNALWIRAHRIRNQLRNRMEDCLRGKRQ